MAASQACTYLLMLPLQATNQAHICPCLGDLKEHLGPAYMPSCGGASGLHALSVGSALGTYPALPFGPCRGGSGLYLPPCGSVSGLGLALLCIQGVNTSGLAALALLASLAGLMLAVPWPGLVQHLRPQYSPCVGVCTFNWPDTGLLSHASEPKRANTFYSSLQIICTGYTHYQ